MKIRIRIHIQYNEMKPQNCLKALKVWIKTFSFVSFFSLVQGSIRTLRCWLRFRHFYLCCDKPCSVYLWLPITSTSPPSHFPLSNDLLPYSPSPTLQPCGCVRVPGLYGYTFDTGAVKPTVGPHGLCVYLIQATHKPDSLARTWREYGRK